MINIVVPMAGMGSRFLNAGIRTPKPLIGIHGRPMIEYVVENIRPKQEYKFIFLCLTDHIEQYSIDEILRGIEPNSEIIPVSGVTEGAACTVLLAEKYIDNDNALMIANSDQYIDFKIDEYLSKVETNDGLIMTMKASGNKWSYVKLDDEGYVIDLREKVEISNLATTGIYNFKHGSDFVKYSKTMIDRNLRVNNEFYVAPVYNLFIEDAKKIVTFDVGSVDNGMHGLGVPEDLDRFINSEISRTIFAGDIAE